MDTNRVSHAAATGLGLPLDAEAIVGEYLSGLDKALPLSRKERERTLVEAADTIACDTEARIAEGAPPEVAAREAVTGLGDPRMLAGQYAAALLPGVARRTGTLLVFSGPAVGMAWVTALGDGTGVAAKIGSLLAGVPLVGLLLTITVPAAVLAAVSGRFRLRHNESGGLAGRAALLAAGGCAAADILLLSTAMGSFASGGFALTRWVAAAGGLSVLRLAGTVTACRRLTRLRAAGY